MANSAQARKRARQTEKQRMHNTSLRSTLRTAIKKVRVALADPAPDVQVLETNLKAAVKRLDRAAAKGLIHRNAAARTKSRLVKQQKQKLGTTAPAAK